MDINVRLEEEKDYRRVEEITRAAFDYPDRIKRGQIGCPYEHWMVHELRHRDGIMALSLVAELENGAILFFGRPEYYPQFGFKQEVFYDDELNRETVRVFDKEFLMRSKAELEKRIQCLEKENQYLKNLLADAGISYSERTIDDSSNEYNPD